MRVIEYYPKMDIDWKPKKIPELIEIVYSAVNCHLLDLKASLYGSGNYHLAPGYGHYLGPHSKGVPNQMMLKQNF